MSSKQKAWHAILLILAQATAFAELREVNLQLLLQAKTIVKTQVRRSRAWAVGDGYARAQDADLCGLRS